MNNERNQFVRRCSFFWKTKESEFQQRRLLILGGSFLLAGGLTDSNHSYQGR